VVKHGGKVNEKFTTNITIMIAEKAGSEKHRNALLLDIPVLLPKWIEDSIKFNILQSMDSYRMKPMHGMFICVTGGDTWLRSDVQERCEEMGANFNSNFVRSCTHMVCLTDEAATNKNNKVVEALRREMHVVSLQWVNETFMNGSSYESSHAISLTQSTQCDTTASSHSPAISMMETSQIQQTSSLFKIREDSQDFIFEDEIFYLVGFNSEERIQINKLIISMGATIAPTPTSFSYVLLSKEDVLKEDEMQQLISKNPLVKIVSYSWLKSCHQSRRVLPIEEKKRKLTMEAPVSVPSIKRVREEDKNRQDEFQKKLDLDDLDGLDLCFDEQPSVKIGIFHGMEFVIYSGLSYLERQTFVPLVDKHQGMIVNTIGKSTLQICPMKMITKVPKGKNVTCRWIQDCVKNDRLFDFKDFPLHQPIHVINNLKYKIHTSSLTSKDRDEIKEFIELLGGEWIKDFNLRQTPLDFMIVDDHLMNDSISTKDKVEKIKKCTFCTVRVVTREWICESVRQGTFLDFEAYSVLPLQRGQTFISVPEAPNSPEVDSVKMEEITFQISKPKLLDSSDDSRYSSDSNSNPPPISLLGDTDSFANELMQLLDKPSEDDCLIVRVQERSGFRKPRKRPMDTKILKFEAEIKLEDKKEEEIYVENNFKKRDLTVESQMAESQVFHFASRDSLGLVQNKQKIFLFSGFTQDEYSRLMGLCEKLGAIGAKDVVDNFTHLVVDTPQKSAKVLAALAGKRPMLKTQFLDDSVSKGSWVSESDYEWTLEQIDTKSSQKSFNPSIVHAYVNNRTKPKPFVGLNVAVIGEFRKEISAILRIGGAKEVDLQNEDEVATLDYLFFDRTQGKVQSIKSRVAKLREINPNFESVDNDFVCDALLAGQVPARKK
jgi:hypothetical protein